MPALKRKTFSARKPSSAMSKFRKFVPRVQPGLYIRKGEQKHVDQLISVSISTTPNFTLLNAIRVGSDDFQRIGKEVKNTQLSLTGGINYTANVSGGADYLRYMVVYDRQANGAAPVISDIIQATTIAGVTSSLPWDHFNTNNEDRFKVLLDKRHNIASNLFTGSNVGAQHQASIERFQLRETINLGKLVTKYKDDSGTIAAISTGSLYFITFGATVAASTNWSITTSSRLTYSDY